MNTDSFAVVLRIASYYPAAYGYAFDDQFVAEFTNEDEAHRWAYLCQLDDGGTWYFEYDAIDSPTKVHRTYSVLTPADQAAADQFAASWRYETEEAYA